jgi:hypothetical protein
VRVGLLAPPRACAMFGKGMAFKRPAEYPLDLPLMKRPRPLSGCEASLGDHNVGSDEIGYAHCGDEGCPARRRRPAIACPREETLLLLRALAVLLTLACFCVGAYSAG